MLDQCIETAKPLTWGEMVSWSDVPIARDGVLCDSMMKHGI